MAVSSALSAFTLVHVLLSILGIGSGLVVAFGLAASKRLDSWTLVFLVSTTATSLTGFFFPFHKLLPSHIIGILSLIALAIAILARYRYHLEGSWRRTYAISATLALYLNVFVLVAQLFQKVPALKAIAPTQSEPSFILAQVVAMALFIVLGILAVKGFRLNPILTATASGQ